MHVKLACRLLASAGYFALAASHIALAKDPGRSQSVFIPYQNATAGQTELTSSPTLDLSFNSGREIPFTMDSGSTGIVVSPDNFTPPSGQQPTGPGTIVYTSSKREFTGEYYMTEVQIGSSAQSATAKVPVLLVLHELCTVGTGACVPANPPHDVAMMGIGFGGHSDTPPNGTPDKNPFLHIIKIAGKPASVSQGWIISAKGATLGITPELSRRFRMVPLTWDSTYHDWTRPTMTLTTNGWSSTGVVLVDTGVASMFLTPPTGDTVPTIPTDEAVGVCLTSGPCAAQGVKVQVTIGMSGARYAFRIGPNGIPNTKQKAAPGWVQVDKWPSTETTAFVNTSYHFLNRFDYLYDYTAGEVGYR